MSKKNSGAPKALTENIVTQNIGDEVLIYNLADHRAMSLNSTVACVWELCDGNNSVAAIAEKAQIKLKCDMPQEVVLLALSELSRHNLLAVNFQETEESDFASALSRRSLIRKVGMTAAVAIPAITAITAPKAIHAASNAGPAPGADGASCNVNEECQNLCCLVNTCQPANACSI